MASAASLMQDLVMAALTNCSLKFYKHLKWHGTTVQTEQYPFPFQYLRIRVFPVFYSKMGRPMAPNATGLVTWLQ